MLFTDFSASPVPSDSCRWLGESSARQVSQSSWRGCWCPASLRPWIAHGFLFWAVGGAQFHLGSFLYLVGLNVSQFLSWYGWLVHWLLNYSMHYYATIEVGFKVLCFYQHVQLWEQIIDENGFCGYFFQVFQANEFCLGKALATIWLEELMDDWSIASTT